MWKKLLRLRELVGDMEMVELGDRLGELFDRPRRRRRELEGLRASLRGHALALERGRREAVRASQGKPAAQGLRPQRARAAQAPHEHRRPVRLRKAQGRHGTLQQLCLEELRAADVVLCGRTEAHPLQFKGKSFGKGGGGKAHPRQEPFRGYHVNEVAGVDEIDAGEAGIDPEDQADEYAEADLDGEISSKS